MREGRSTTWRWMGLGLLLLAACASGRSAVGPGGVAEPGHGGEAAAEPAAMEDARSDGLPAVRPGFDAPAGTPATGSGALAQAGGGGSTPPTSAPASVPPAADKDRPKPLLIYTASFTMAVFEVERAIAGLRID